MAIGRMKTNELPPAINLALDMKVIQFHKREEKQNRIYDMSLSEGTKIRKWGKSRFLEFAGQSVSSELSNNFRNWYGPIEICACIG